ncbi:MAG TPA: efflux RND transporter periplasmic adaptor subunit [Bacteroidales bacterium]|nr:efflux RND transporter periplasmic adaptor subunit [Bacteroidales bacterium]
MVLNRVAVKVAAVALLISFPFLIISCKSKKETEQEKPVLKVLQIQGVTIPVYLETVGQAEGIPTVEIRARVQGYLQNWSFEEGSIVKKGQHLFTIEQDNYINDVNYATADLESKQAAWEKAKLDVARLKPLLATNAISQNDYDVAVTTEKQTRAAVQSGEANLADAKLNLSYTTITSPITGCIGKVQVNPGNLVGRGESTLLTTVSAVDPMYVNFQVNENDYLRLKRYVDDHHFSFAEAQQTFKVFLTLADKIPYKTPGKIDFVDRSINTQTGTIAMRAVFDNPDELIKPGNFATVDIVFMERENAVVIPQSAITQIQGKNFVFLVNNENKVNRVPVVPGRAIGNKIVITQGLKPGDKILLEGFQKFQEGMMIQPNIVKDTVSAPKQ